MGCFTDFFKGYKQTQRQECKFRLVQNRPSENPSNEEYWKNREDYLDAVPSVSFSFGQSKQDKDHPEMLSLEIPGTGEPYGYRTPQLDDVNRRPLSQSAASSPHGVPTYNDRSELSSRSSQTASRKASRPTSKSGGKTPSRPTTADDKSQASEGHVHKEGEWMYQLNALAKEHAQRNRPEKPQKEEKPEKSEKSEKSDRSRGSDGSDDSDDTDSQQSDI